MTSEGVALRAWNFKAFWCRRLSYSAPTQELQVKWVGSEIIYYCP